MASDTALDKSLADIFDIDGNFVTTITSKHQLVSAMIVLTPNGATQFVLSTKWKASSDPRISGMKGHYHHLESVGSKLVYCRDSKPMETYV